jgi:hypothetical protein
LVMSLFPLLMSLFPSTPQGEIPKRIATRSG